jgi:hypothetical protein
MNYGCGVGKGYLCIYGQSMKMNYKTKAGSAAYAKLPARKL